MSTIDRDPYSQGQLAAAVAVYMNAVHPLSTISRDEADAELEAALLQQGVINPSEVVEEISTDLNTDAIEWAGARIAVILTTGESIVLFNDGLVA